MNPDQTSAKNSIFSSSYSHNSSCAMWLHQTHRKQGYTADTASMRDGGSAVETQSTCSMPFLQGLKDNTCHLGDARNNTSWSLTMTTRLRQTKETHRWVLPLGHAATSETYVST